MNAKKIIAHIVLVTSTVICSAQETIPVDMSQSIQQEPLLTNNLQTENLSPEKKFMCTERPEGTVCQMYECVNTNCRVSSPLKFNNSMTTPQITSQESKTIQSEAMENEAISNAINLEKKEFNVPSTSNEETNQLLMTNINMPLSLGAQEEIRELKDEIYEAERSCERAESDPRQQAICEDASAEVQWRKEKIKTLEGY